MSALFSFDGLTFTFGHLFGEGLFALFFNIANASGAVRIKQECEYFAYPVGKQLAFLDIMGAFSTSIELTCLFIMFASGAFFCQELTAGSAIKTASSYVLSVRYDSFHKRQILE